MKSGRQEQPFKYKSFSESGDNMKGLITSFIDIYETAFVFRVWHFISAKVGWSVTNRLLFESPLNPFSSLSF